MEKALQDCFYVQMTNKTGITLKRHPERYDRKFVSYLIDGANNHVTQLKGRDSNQSSHDEFIYWCISEYLNNGASPALLNTLNRNISVVGHQCHVMPIGKKFVAMFIAHIPQNPPTTVFASYMFSNMTSLGWLEGLKKCRNPDCLQFFIGRSNVKWCSKSCGSLFRVRHKRKRDRA
jgi:hypothetical protein